jgi:hypothetical protein
MDPLYEIINLYSNLFKNEHFRKVPAVVDREGMHRKVSYFAAKGVLEFDSKQNTVIVKNKE